MTYEEKLIRYIASKLIQKKYYIKKGEFPSEPKIAQYVNIVVNDLQEQHRQLKYVRTHSENGLITPAIASSVDKIKF